ncbi:MAG TPA: class A beta-lactamase [Rhizomicrobium sp.]|jgi:beta-lactamase class A
MSFSRRIFLGASAAFVAGAADAAQDVPAVAGYEKETGGRIGVHAQNLKTGKKLAWRAEERFVMCSTFKASLTALTLSRVDRGKEDLGRVIAYGVADLQDFYAPVAKENLARGHMTVAEMCEAAVEYSDNACANLLLASAGGPAAVTNFWRATGDAVSRLDHNEPVLNRSKPGDPHDTTTPAAMAGNLRRFLLGDVLSDKSRTRLLDWMIGCKTGANRLRGGLPPAWQIADKTGNNGADAAGDIAMVWPAPDTPLVICVYTQGGKPSDAQFQNVFADIGRAVTRMLV